MKLGKYLFAKLPSFGISLFFRCFEKMEFLPVVLKFNLLIIDIYSSLQIS